MAFLHFILGLGLVVVSVQGHGLLWEPAQRSSAWRKGYNTPINYNDNELFCGGFYHQWDLHGGKCGACGDPYNGNLENEAGGLYATGTITGTYQSGGILPVTVHLTAYHMGWFEFRLCAHNNVNTRVSQTCLDQNLLEIIGNGTRLNIGHLGTEQGKGDHYVSLQLPAGVTCQQCVLQWKYNTGNSWGIDEEGNEGLGYGHQEQFINCADIKITDSTNSETSSPASSTTTSSTTSTTSLTSSSTSTTSTTSSNGSGQCTCSGAGEFSNYPGMAAWCLANCMVQYCPENYCQCTENIIRVSNRLDPDEAPSYSAPHLDPNCLQM